MSKKHDFEMMKRGSKCIGTIYKPELYDSKILFTSHCCIVCEYNYSIYDLWQSNLIRNEGTFDMFTIWNDNDRSVWK